MHRNYKEEEWIKKCGIKIYYWPGIASDISNMTRNCQECNKHTNNRAPTESSSVQSVFHRDNEKYLILADKCSGYIVTKHITDKSRNRITSQLTEWFNLLG